MNEIDKKRAIPYLKGLFLLGLAIPASIWLIQVSDHLARNQAQDERIRLAEAAAYIGQCYISENCRHIVVNNPVKTIADRENVVNQIKVFMGIKEKPELETGFY